jgi:membrane protein DedA with SNARE-associated domain
LITEIETTILSTAKTLYDAWGWLGVATLLTFENTTGATPSEIILGLAGWIFIYERQLPVSMIFIGGFYSAIGSELGASISYWMARLGGRVIPGIRTLISIPAGLARMKYPRFLAATYAGTYIWCTLLIGAGFLLGYEWPLGSDYVNQSFPNLIVVGILTLVTFLLLTYRARIMALAKARNTDLLIPGLVISQKGVSS